MYTCTRNLRNTNVAALACMFLWTRQSRSMSLRISITRMLACL